MQILIKQLIHYSAIQVHTLTIFASATKIRQAQATNRAWLPLNVTILTRESNIYNDKFSYWTSFSTQRS